MAINRQLEPEMDDTPEGSQEYLDMGHREVNKTFVDDLIASGPVGPRVVDLGCGPALIPIELCNRLEQVEVMAVDGAIEMLELARFELEFAGQTERILLEHVDIKSMNYFDDDMADTVMSNSVLHHLPDPAILVANAVRLTKPGGRVFIRDLVRPESADAVDALVNAHAADESPAGQKMLRESLHAALTLNEIRQIAAENAIGEDCVQMTSDRHWTLDWTKS